MRAKALIIAGMMALTAMPAAAAVDFVVVRREIAVARPAAAVWSAVGADYCSIRVWLSMTCAITKGDGGIGATRLLNGMTEEVMVANSPMSYTYLQTVGGRASYNYHGTLSVEPGANARSSKIVYTLVYDQGAMDEKTRNDTRTGLETRFQGAVESMKKLVETK
jgi:hypothetical protein